MLLAVSTLFFAIPRPLEMPHAEAYYVSGDVPHLEDRYDELDLWTSRAVAGRWEDADGRIFSLSRLDVMAPRFAGPSVTRAKYDEGRVFLSVKDKDAALRLEAASLLSPILLAENPEPPRHPIRGMKDAGYWHGTNGTCLVCAFLPEKSPRWYLATWELAPDDEMDVAVENFEAEILSRWDDLDIPSERNPGPLADASRKAPTGKKRKIAEMQRERELFSADLSMSVTNYAGWHFTASDGFAVIDDLPEESGFVTSLTNELQRMYSRYSATIPSPISGSNTLSVARICRNREEYLALMDIDGVDGMEWSAAYWDRSRRQLAAYLPPDGEKELMKTFRHEAFHQYLSYACSMMTAAPWINEGYAQYFEDEDCGEWGIDIDIDAAAETLPAVMAMDYSQFYSGTDADRRVKYRIAWSIAYFLENGADEVRFRPFAGVKRKYLETLLKSQDMQLATFEAFGTADNFRLFAAEWKKYWKERNG